jgi:DNA modification methylase
LAGVEGAVMEPTWEDKQFGVKLYLADCMDVIPTMGKVDAVVTDPPYGMRNNTNSKRFSGSSKAIQKRRGNGGGRFSGIIPGDDKDFDPAPFLVFPSVIMWGANHYSSRLGKGTTLVWIKRNDESFGTFLSDAEIGFQKGGCGVYCFKDLSMKACERERKHPNQKPLPLMSWCIERISQESDVIFDPFMGSGTTGVASIQLGRQFIGIEREPKYFEIAVRRISEAIVKKQGGALCATHIPTQLGLLG